MSNKVSCVSCNTLIDKRNKRCHTCYLKYIKPELKDTNRCVDCDKEISQSATRCSSCNNKGAKNPLYKGEVSLKNVKKFCTECDKQLYWRNKSGLCGSCVKKGKYFGKRLDKNKCINCKIEISNNSTRCRKCFAKHNSGENNYAFGKTFTHSKETKEKIANASSKRKGINSPLYGKKRPDLAGSNHYNWKGGTRKLNKEIRNLLEYKNWRLSIFQRDNFTCQICNKTNTTINADHIKPYCIIIQQNNITNVDDAVTCEELWDINNGRTLCVDCHKQTPTYGNRFDLLIKHKNK